MVESLLKGRGELERRVGPRLALDLITGFAFRDSGSKLQGSG